MKPSEELMTTSTGHGAVAGTPQNVSRLLRALRHPFWTMGTVARGVAARSGPASARRAANHLLKRMFPLRLTVPARRWADGNDPSAAVRWAGPINLRHRTLEALLCLPPGGIEYRTKAPAGSYFVCECGVSPEVWQDAPPAIEFAIDLHVPAADDWKTEVKMVLDPGARWTDRCWHSTVIRMPSVSGSAFDVTVTLRTTLAGPGKNGNAWALFGEPRFEIRRPASAVWSSIATLYRRVRHQGLRPTFELLRTAGIATEDAATYARWVIRNTRSEAELAALAQEVAALEYQPLISIIVPSYNTDARWLRAAVASVKRQAYRRWELCICDDASTAPDTVSALRELQEDPKIHVTFASRNRGISEASNAALRLARGEFVAFLDHDDELAPDALAEIVRHLNAHPDADLIYSDEDKLDARGERCDPYFKPDWSPDHFLETMYTCHLMVIRREVLESVGGFRQGYEGAQDYDLVLRITEKTSRIHHIPRILYHWRKHPQSTASAAHAKPWALDAGKLALEDYVRRNHADAEVLEGVAPGLYRLRRRIRGEPLVSIIIPTSGKPRDVAGKPLDLLAQAIRSVVEQTAYQNYELILVADAGGLHEPCRRALEGCRHVVLRFERSGPFNFSAKINYGALAASGDHLVLFNDDLEVISSEWLSAMLEYSQEPGVGAVGAKLLYPDGRLQHIGMTLGVAGVAAHAFHQHRGTSPGYAGSALTVRNYSAVTAACLMTRRTVFDEVGRFDESFPVDFNDVDYCLRVRRHGYRIAFTPWARLYHHESASFGTRRQDLDALNEMRRRWASVIDNDPYYNPNLTRDFPDYRLDG